MTKRPLHDIAGDVEFSEALKQILNPFKVIKERYCEVRGCSNFANYSQKKEKEKKRCKTHKLEDDIKTNLYCVYPECEKTAYFGCPKSRKKLRCREHSLEYDVDLKSGKK